MNTDNVTISGETIDYGPCAFLDAFDRAAVFSSIDEGGRYAYGNQPPITEWNLARLAEALLPLLHDDEAEGIAIATDALRGFRDEYAAALSDGLRVKLGLGTDVDDAVLTPLMTDLMSLMQESRVDPTAFWRALADAARGDAEPARGRFVDLAGFDAWTERWRALSPDPDVMDRANPVYVPRNHLVEEALDAATDGDLAPFGRLVDAVTRPFDERPGLERYAEAAPDDFGDYTTFCGT